MSHTILEFSRVSVRIAGNICLVRLLGVNNFCKTVYMYRYTGGMPLLGITGRVTAVFGMWSLSCVLRLVELIVSWVCPLKYWSL